MKEGIRKVKNKGRGRRKGLGFLGSVWLKMKEKWGHF